MVVSSQFVSRIALKPDADQDVSCYLFCLPALRDFSKLELHPTVTFSWEITGPGSRLLVDSD